MVSFMENGTSLCFYSEFLKTVSCETHFPVYFYTPDKNGKMSFM